MSLTVPPIHSPPLDPAEHAIQTVPAVQVAASINAQAVLRIDLFSQADGVYPPVRSHSFSTPDRQFADPATPAVRVAQMEDPITVLDVQV